MQCFLRNLAATAGRYDTARIGAFVRGKMAIRQLDWRNFKRYHFIGIGGSGMSGIAEAMHSLGFAVSGSDIADSSTMRRLAKLGITTYIGHDPVHIGEADAVVVSNAVHADNPELQQARKTSLVVTRAEMLGTLMRSGTGFAVAGAHGKSTVTSMLGHIFGYAGESPTVVVGGLIRNLGTHGSVGSGDLFIAEADESDDTFLYINPTSAIVTNLDKDHLERFDGDFQSMLDYFYEFLRTLPFYGYLVLNSDSSECMELGKRLGRNFATFGAGKDAHYRIERQIGSDGQDCKVIKGGQPICSFSLKIPGEHNARNATAAVAMADLMGIDRSVISTAMQTFAGVGRRFEDKGETKIFGGPKVRLIDDYGHHPTELRATIATARELWPDRRLTMLFQPHRFTRMAYHLHEFAAELSPVDKLVLTDVYSAGEPPIAGGQTTDLCRALQARGCVPVLASTVDMAVEVLRNLVLDGDVLLLQGAGDIVRAGEKFSTDEEL